MLPGAFDGPHASTGRQPSQQRSTQHRGDDRCRQDPQLRGVEVIVAERQTCDEQRHREADAGQHATASQHAPAEVRRPDGDARADRQPAEGDDAKGLPQRKSEKHGRRDRILQVCDRYRYTWFSHARLSHPLVWHIETKP